MNCAPDDPAERNGNRKVEPDQSVRTLKQHGSRFAVLPFRDPAWLPRKVLDVVEELLARHPIRPVIQGVNLGVRMPGQFGNATAEGRLANATHAGHKDAPWREREGID